MRVIREELQNGAYIKRTIRKAVNDDLEMCDTISQIGHVGQENVKTINQKRLRVFLKMGFV